MRLLRYAAILLALSPVPLAAQGVFNMGSLTQTVSIPTGNPPARIARDRGVYRAALRPRPRPPVVDRAALQFRRDPAITRRVQQALLARISSPAERAATQRTFNGNITATITQQMNAWGMQYGNLADALAVFAIAAWQATHGRYNDVPAQYRAVTRQMAVAVTDAGLARATNAQRQELAETALYEAVMIAAAQPDAQRDPKVRAQTARLATGSSRALLGMDVGTMRLSNAGLGL